MFAFVATRVNSCDVEFRVDNILHMTVFSDNTALLPSVNSEYKRLQSDVERITDSLAYQNTQTVASYVPYASELMSILTSLLNNIIEIVDIVPTIIEQELSKNLFRTIKSCMAVIKNNLEQLKIATLPNTSKVAITHDIHNEFVRILELLDDRSGAKEYDRYSAPIVLNLASLYYLFSPFMWSFNKPLAQHSRLVCDLKNTLTEYRSYVIFDKIKTEVASGIDRENGDLAPCASSAMAAMRNLNTPIQPFSSRNLEQDLKIPYNAAVYVRAMVEKSFDHHIRIANQTCSNLASNQYKTG